MTHVITGLDGGFWYEKGYVLDDAHWIRFVGSIMPLMYSDMSDMGRLEYMLKARHLLLRVADALETIQ